VPDSAGYWAHGDAYERYMGRWSRRIAEPFVLGLGAPPRLRWVDVGCGTGALSSAVLDLCAPESLLGVDSAAGLLESARARFAGRGASVRFELADAARLPLDDDAVDVAVSGLVLNFVPSPEAVVAEITRVVRPAGIVAAYVWDYAAGMPIMSTFWDAAVALDPDADALDQSADVARRAGPRGAAGAGTCEPAGSRGRRHHPATACVDGARARRCRLTDRCSLRAGARLR
jgi:ubiquinone/menaquinone biosynthesis C-methylase UbiE